MSLCGTVSIKHLMRSLCKQQASIKDFLKCRIYFTRYLNLQPFWHRSVWPENKYDFSTLGLIELMEWKYQRHNL
jgi:hypothetical protein